MQSLYEHHKVLTYPRTDSRYLTADMADTIKERLKAVSVGPYKQWTAKLMTKPVKASASFIDDGRVSDHHAIIPTEQPVFLSDMSFEERKIFDLVVKRFLAVLSPACEYEQTSVSGKSRERHLRQEERSWSKPDGKIFIGKRTTKMIPCLRKN